jgi:hypothetical protein
MKTSEPTPEPAREVPAAPTIEPARTIVRLLSSEKKVAARTVLITGPWGSGKTYMWKETIVPAINRPHIYVSAFGAENAAALKGRLLTHFGINIVRRAPVSESKATGKIKEWFTALKSGSGRLGQAVGEIMNSVGASLLRRVDVDPIELVDLIDPNTVICIDDLERTSQSFPVADLLGIANILSEHKALDVVLICNEEHITGSDPEVAKKYLTYKEKTVANVFYVSSDPVEMFDRIAANSVRSADASARVTAAADVIKQVFSTSGTTNLRLLAAVCRHLELMHAAGVRELADDEIRFLCAATIYDATTATPDASFYDFNALLLRMTRTVRENRKPTPLDAARQAFLDGYFGGAEYKCYPPLLDVIRKGLARPGDFVYPVEPPPSEFKKNLASAVGGDWVYFTDPALKELRDKFVGYLSSDSIGSAADVLMCLGFVRYWAGVFGEPEPEAIKVRVSLTLSRLAAAGDQSVGHEWEMHANEVLGLVKEEHAAYVRDRDLFERLDLAKRIVAVISSGDLGEAVSLLAEPRLLTLQVVFQTIGIDPILALRKTDPKRFRAIAGLLLTKCDEFKGLWPEASQHKDRLVEALNAIANEQSEEHMTRWRVQGILKRPS